MEDLKENTQKKNTKKLVLFISLGMFCYCSNNVSMASTSPINKQTENNNKENILQKEKDLIEQKGSDEATLQPSETSVPLISKGAQILDNITVSKNKEKKGKGQDEECCPCCCCCEKTKPVEGEDKKQTKEKNFSPISIIEETQE